MKIKWSDSGNTSSATVDGIGIVILGDALKASYPLDVVHDGYHVSVTLEFQIQVKDRDDDAATAVEILKGVAAKINGH